MKKAIVSNPSEPFGQHMLDDQVQKIFTFKGTISCIGGLAFNILKSYLAILIWNDIFSTDNAAI